MLATAAIAAVAGCATVNSAREAASLADHKTILAYTQAYNQRDVSSMAALMHDDIQWLSIEGDKISVVANGKDDLVAQMHAYVTSGATTKSSIEGRVADGRHIAVREIARWTDQSGAAAQQSSLSVYEIEGGLVRRIWYYPVTR